jgi:hypothetical protein
LSRFFFLLLLSSSSFFSSAFENRLAIMAAPGIDISPDAHPQNSEEISRQHSGALSIARMDLSNCEGGAEVRRPSAAGGWASFDMGKLRRHWKMTTVRRFAGHFARAWKSEPADSRLRTHETGKIRKGAPTLWMLLSQFLQC